MDWHRWHEAYEAPGSSLRQRLKVVQQQIGAALDAAPAGPIRVISVCSGQGRDLLPVLATHPRRDEVAARLVELDPENAAVARRSAEAANLTGVEVVVGDGGRTDAYRGAAPADLVLLCGVLGNISDADVRRTVDFCDQLCAAGGTLVWTRHRDAPDLVPQICDWLGERSFEQRWLSAPDAGYGVGVHRFTGEPRPLVAGEQLFTFIRES
ncbi:class I SAM-dependent methyltransferase family protein [Natronosporangium hydrolyticum]|uniref:Class I SAM-dependent methyltransferase family protein n=1 Tax=Natronosporangium hydrolyticum TaxID=2811111 RepID=A0A895YCR6_9ACTN|nr:SAM-dependent methyltransferase [Natronosporangium hydrolyticum]QSB13243.1 class I SAM-dependent methyltransferase family protein [Natronosporangium hydrolyticum]